MTREPSEDYGATVGIFLSNTRVYIGNEPGDPAKAAVVLLDVAAMDEPPPRLLLGSDAVDMVRGVGQARTAEIDKWAHVSRSTAFGRAIGTESM